MKYLDEYQRIQRYKFGYYTLILTAILHSINFYATELYNLQWAETPRLEPLIILLIAAFFYSITLVYSGAYFAKGEVYFKIPACLLIGGLILWTSFFFPLIEQRRVTLHMTFFIVGINFIAIPATYLVRMHAD